MDDKAKIPIGEPGTPEAATRHMRKAITTKKVTLESSDHNYHSVNMTSSVNLICDIPDSATGSFYRGQVFDGIKDSVFEGSDPMRHIVELLSVLRANSLTSIHMVMFSDGGADHNLTFSFVQCVLLALFRILDLDALNVGRCAPCQSYINPAGRVMSILNIGLQGLALERDGAGAFEKEISSCQSMKSLRAKDELHHELRNAYLSSVESCRRLFEYCFSQLRLKGKEFKIFQPKNETDEVLKPSFKLTRRSKILVFLTRELR